MWENSLESVESDNNKILYETVLTFWISLVVFEKKNNYLGATLFPKIPHGLTWHWTIVYAVKAIYYSRIIILISIPTVN